MTAQATIRMKDSDLSSAGWHEFTCAAPMERAFNHLIAGTYFEQKFERWPLPPLDSAALINDLIFSRMIDPRWSPLQRALVDKSTAKTEAQRLCPSLRLPETLAVIPMESVRSADHLHGLLQPFIGTDAIAKPSHASGGTVFLTGDLAPADIHVLHELAAIDYATIMREMQYWRLPRKVIVEALVRAAATTRPNDFKFHCIDGEPLLCQVDHSRFGDAWSRLYRVPSFEPMYPGDGLVPPDDYRLPDRDRLAALIAAARALAAPFDFVRVDLYDGIDGVYFGEATFTPAASLGIAPSAAGCHRVTATHREYSDTLMTAFRSGR
ncbi:ATP-grasp fold amidoligase family protein [Sphingomonas qomolangmaensis]|uniref:TupA-like ATPgrasp n=1 Tax=Sphingomonas qomolangmaensis TaxID=2918765 RepID=A0ABY5LGG7_9SPHN|nr:ATP-grasp fold amidoligase family protein [Sphingomonas qomolangmaensis]UUL83806.1 hypothetical protein NMP03_06320 [Sphingomonas qomolangmaensis]